MKRPGFERDEVLLLLMLLAIAAFCAVFGWRLVQQLAAAP